MIEEKDEKIAELEARLVDKESQGRNRSRIYTHRGRKPKMPKPGARSRALPPTIVPFLPTVPSHRNTPIP